MAQVNTCLKRTFTTFNVLFAVVGGVIVVLALLLQMLYHTHGGEDFEGQIPVLILLYVIGGVTMAIAILGAYGAHKENRAALIVFLVCMVLGSLLMLKAGVSAALNRSTFQTTLESHFRTLVPLDQSPENVQNKISSMQSTLECCGLFSYADWRSHVPDSCSCSPGLEEQGEKRCMQIQSSEMLVFREPCVPVIMHLINIFLNICLVVIFCLAALALLGLVLSSIILHQMRVRPASLPTVLVRIPAVFTPQPPKYQELYNAPQY